MRQMLTIRFIRSLLAACLVSLLAYHVILADVGQQASTQPANRQQQPRKEKALALLLQAQEVIKSEPNLAGKAFALLAIGEAYAKLGEKARAEKLLAESSRLMESVDHLPDGWSKNVFLVPLARAYVAAGNRQKAEEILDQINARAELVGPDHQAQVLSALVPVYVSLGKNDRAAELLSRTFLQVNEMSDSFDRNHGLSQLAVTYASLGQREQAIQIGEMVGGFPDRSWSDIAMGFAVSGDVEASLLASRKIKPGGFVVKSFCWAAAKYIALGKKEKALTILREITPPTIGKRKISATMPWEDLAILWTWVGHYDKALALVDRIKAQSPKLRALTSLAPSFAKAHRQNQANQLLRKAAELSAFSKGSYYEARDLQQVGRAYGQIGRKDEASKFLSRSVEALKAQEGEPVHDIVLRDIALTYAEMEMDDQALDAIEKISGATSKAETLVALASFWLSLKADDKGPPIG